jgi:uncharacterized membrane protein YadS
MTWAMRLKRVFNIAMAAVGLVTSFKGLKEIGPKPFVVGFLSAVLVGIVSYVLITILY